MSEEIPQWAVDRARDLISVDPGLIVTAQDIGDAFARYIAAHEQPPVDPDVIAVREILATWLGTDCSGNSVMMEDEKEILRGDQDDDPDFQSALAAFRKHKEAGK